jgi:hypothetical protein
MKTIEGFKIYRARSPKKLEAEFCEDSYEIPIEYISSAQRIPSFTKESSYSAGVESDSQYGDLVGYLRKVKEGEIVRSLAEMHLFEVNMGEIGDFDGANRRVKTLLATTRGLENHDILHKAHNSINLARLLRTMGQTENGSVHLKKGESFLREIGIY